MGYHHIQSCHTNKVDVSENEKVWSALEEQFDITFIWLLCTQYQEECQHRSIVKTVRATYVNHPESLNTHRTLIMEKTGSLLPTKVISPAEWSVLVIQSQNMSKQNIKV